MANNRKAATNQMKKHCAVIFLYLPFLFTCIAKAQVKVNPLQLWYEKPAADWMTEALPIGNGRIGGMVFGCINEEHLQFNEQSLWTGNEDALGAYQNLGALFVKLSGQTTTLPTNYRRTLDIGRSVHTVSYSADGVQYQREAFCSFPDQAMVVRFTADRKSAYNAVIVLKDAHEAKPLAQGLTLVMKGKLNNGLEYETRLLLQHSGGKVTVEKQTDGSDQLRVVNADAIQFILLAGTNYASNRNSGWRGQNPTKKLDLLANAVVKKSYNELLNRHVKDYQALFNRVEINLGKTDETVLQLPTYQRILAFKEKRDPAIESLLYQYGRYLLISSSRKGGLPANLQGLWNNSNNPPWKSDYHSNINVQMNYWLAEPTNLAESHTPFLDYISSMREVRQVKTTQHYPGVRGWTVQTENNTFGAGSFLWNPPGSAWYAQHLWEHYAFGNDLDYLKNQAYPVLKEVCEFWEDHLKKRVDGTLVTPDGWSPENGPVEEGVTYDQEIIYDLFTNYIAAADLLGVDQAYRTKVSAMRDHLLKPKIGKWGQLQEWETDRDDPKSQHRHVSQLFALHPGKMISPVNTPALAEAAKVSLTARGDGATGWSMAWKINFWARLLDGDHAYIILKNFITPVGGMGITTKGGGIYANLFCAHPPFQIDGNFGYTAGVTEMLLQSQQSELHLLPALPNAWKEGSIKGIRGRGGFQLDLTWKDAKLLRVVITSSKAQQYQVRYGNLVRVLQFKANQRKILDNQLNEI